MAVGEQMLIFFLLVLAGIIARRRGIITLGNERQFSALVVDVTCPAMIVASVADGRERMGASDLLVALVAVGLVFALTLILANALPRMLRYPEPERRAVNVMATVTNMGFIGMPLLASLYGNGALIYLTVFLLVSTIIFYTYCLRLMAGDGTATANLGRQILSPGMLACFMALLLYLTETPLPYALAETLRLIGGMTAPLAMMLLGAALSHVAWRDAGRDIRALGFIAIRMVLFPVAALLLLRQFVCNTELLGACFIVLATPVGGMVAMLAALYDPEKLPLVARTTSLSTAASAFTLPLVALLAGLSP